MRHNFSNFNPNKHYRLYKRKKFWIVASASSALALSLGIFTDKIVHAVDVESTEVEVTEKKISDETPVDVGYVKIIYIDDDPYKTPETEQFLETQTEIQSIEPGMGKEVQVSIPKDYESISPEPYKVDVQANTQTELVIHLRHKVVYNQPTTFSLLHTTFVDVPQNIKTEILKQTRIIYWGNVIDLAAGTKKFAAYNNLAGTTRLYEIPKINFTYDDTYAYTIGGGVLDIFDDTATLLTDLQLDENGLTDFLPTPKLWLKLQMTKVTKPDEPKPPVDPPINPPVDPGDPSDPVVPDKPDKPDKPKPDKPEKPKPEKPDKVPPKKPEIPPVNPNKQPNSNNESRSESQSLSVNTQQTNTQIAANNTTTNQPGSLLKNFLGKKTDSNQEKQTTIYHAKEKKNSHQGQKKKISSQSPTNSAQRVRDKKTAKDPKATQNIAFLSGTNTSFSPVGGGSEHSELGQFFSALSGVTNFGLRN